ncbi:MAG: hypothetical protein ACRDRJ_00725 [Streptosporangiaceae bacterium]
MCSYQARRKDGTLVHPDDVIKDFHGFEWTFKSVSRAPDADADTNRRIVVADEFGREREVFDTVFDLVISDAPSTWTIAYRKPRANKFHRVTDWAGTWQQATEMAAMLTRAHPELQVYYVPTKATEDAQPGREDNGNILIDNGRRDIAKWSRVRMTETGTVSTIPQEMRHPRRAEVRGRKLSEVEAYLPANYTATSVFKVGGPDAGHVIEILGYDSAGWTLDGYVIPRLASGLITAHEV